MTDMNVKDGAGREPPIIIFSNSWAMGGAEQHIIDLSEALVMRGRRVAVICWSVPAIAPMRDGLRARGVEVHELRGGASPTGRLKRLLHLRAILGRYPRCIVHLSEGWPAGDGLVILAAMLTSARAIVRTEHQPPVSPVSFSQLVLTRLKDRYLSAIICVSEENRRAHLRELGREPRKVRVIPNGIHVEKFAGPGDPDSVRREFGIAPEQPLVGIVARLSEERKGVNFFIEMAALVTAEEPAVRFIVVGDGPLRPGIEAHAAARGLSGRIVFAGERQDIARLLKALTVFVQPSLQEGASYVLLEALATGTPVVATPAGSAEEMLTHGETGMIIPMRNPQALAGAVLTLLRDPALGRRIGDAGSSLIRSRYSVETMVERYIEVYHQISGT